MNILHLEASPGWGGQEIRILKEAVGMKKKGHNVFIVVMQDGELAEKAREEGIVTYELNFYKKAWFKSFFALWKIIRKNKISLINTHSSLDAWLGGIVSKFCRIPVVRTRHLSTKVRPGLNSILLYHFFAKRVVTTCKKIIPMLSDQSKKPINHFYSIPTGVDFNAMQVDEQRVLEFRKNLGIKDTDLLVGTVCFMRSWKGLDDLLGAAKILKDKKDIKWVIIGGGHQDAYRKKAKQLNLEDTVYFTGHLDAPFYAIKALDIFTLLSTAHEGVSQASLQAAFLQRPLIATSTGGLSEVCIDGKTGVQVPCFSPEKVAEAVLSLKELEEKRRSFGLAAKKLVSNQFTFEKMLDQMEKVYLEAENT